MPVVSVGVPVVSGSCNTLVYIPMLRHAHKHDIELELPTICTMLKYIPYKCTESGQNLHPKSGVFKKIPYVSLMDINRVHSTGVPFCKDKLSA